jgi:hypothetical protein
MGKVTISLTNLVLDETYTAWYRLTPTEAAQTQSTLARAEAAPRRDISDIQIQVQLKLSVK